MSQEDHDTLWALAVVGMLLVAGLLHWLHQPAAVPVVWP